MDEMRNPETGAAQEALCTVMTDRKRGELRLPAERAEILPREFFGQDDLEEVFLSPRIEKIGRRGFCSCDGLARVRFCEGLREIGEQAFSFCRKLTELVLPAGVEYVGEEAFLTCTSLRRIAVRSARTGFGEQVFRNCAKDAVMTVPRRSCAEGYAIENGIRYVYDDGTEPDGGFRVRVSADGNWLEDCYLRITETFDCSARSDGGVEEHSGSVRRYRIPADWRVEEAGRLIGVRFRDHLFRLDDRDSLTLARVLKNGFVGGWGDVTETEECRLFIGVPPSEAKPMAEKD